MRPHTALKRGGLNIEWKRGRRFGTGYSLCYLSSQIGHAVVITTPQCKRKLLLQSLLQFFL
jgi:hypothetical protein